MENTDFSLIKERLSSPLRIVLTTHSNPDGDAIGSCLALYQYLYKKKHTVHVIIPDPFPEFLAWLPYQEDILIFKQHQKQCISLISNANVIFSIDYNNLNRLNEAEPYISGSEAFKVLFDHHLYPAQQFDLMISTPETSSTAELVYDYIISSGDQQLLDRHIAECIYAGIVTDTGSFSYSCNYVKTYQVIAELYRLGINGEHIHRMIYDTYSENRLRLLGHSISEKLIVLPGFHTAYITLDKSELQRFEYRVGDTEGVVNFALSIKDINLAALFMERDGIVKVSFRSKGNFSVDQFAREHFNGGGHTNASGANCETSLKETVQKFLSLLPEYSAKLDKVYE